MRRVVLATLLVLLAAGCSGLDDTSESVTLPPGVSEDGIQRPVTLIEAHGERLEEVPYTVSDTFVSEPAGEKPGVRIEREIRFGADPSRYWSRSRMGFWDGTSNAIDNHTVVSWSNGTAVAINTTTGEGSTYAGTTDADERFYPKPSPSQYRDDLYVLFLASNLSVTSTEEDEITLTGTIPGEAGSVTSTFDAAGQPDNATVTNTDVQLVVSESGQIRWWRVSWDVVLTDGTRYRESRTVRITDVVSTEVPRPDWVERAVNNTSAPAGVPVSMGG